MQRSVLGIAQTLRKSVLVLCLLSLISLSGLFAFEMPAYATSLFNQKPAQEKVNPAEAARRADAYEEAVKEAQSLESIEKTYEENLKEYKQENPDPSLIEQAEELVEKVTGQE